jgi:hypothetical protein
MKQSEPRVYLVIDEKSEEIFRSFQLQKSSRDDFLHLTVRFNRVRNRVLTNRSPLTNDLSSYKEKNQDTASQK